LVPEFFLKGSEGTLKKGGLPREKILVNQGASKKNWWGDLKGSLLGRNFNPLIFLAFPNWDSVDF